MKILFISFYKEYKIEVFPGIGMLSKLVKEKSYEAKLYPYLYYDEEQLIKVMNQFKPDFVAISATSLSILEVEKVSGFIHQNYDLDIILGGIFPILETERALSISEISAVCIGDGTVGFMEYIEGKHPATNYHYRNGDKGPFMKWSQKIVEIDYEIFKEASEEFGIPMSRKLDVWTSYTCRHDCSFCCSESIRRKTVLKSKPRLSPEDAIVFIRNQLLGNEYSKIHFRDPLFLGVGETEWVKSFLTKYVQEIKIPFTCNIRADMLDENILDLLVYAGCSQIKMGLESGDERFRIENLNKRISNQMYYKVRKLISNKDIELSLNAMLGLPHETKQLAKKTIDMMIKLEPDKSFVHIFQPWVGVKLDTDVVKYIRQVEEQKFNNIHIIGKMKSNDLCFPDSIDKSKMLQEKVRIPILDQPQFRYKDAIWYQREYLNKIDKKNFS